MPHDLAHLERRIVAAVGSAWTRGWQPAELLRQVRRRADRNAQVLAEWAVAADHAGRDPASIHQRWADQVAALELPAVRSAAGWIAGLVESVGGPAADGRAVVAVAAVDLLDVVARLGPIEMLLPPPGASPADWLRFRSLTGTHDPLLEKVRRLLAQAESTTFPGEAEVFTAKAHELMARHAIDTAMLWERSARADRPGVVRLPIDEPYVTPKSTLLHVVASRSRCRSVFQPTYAVATLVGFEADLAAVEVLFTSLLVQAQTALWAEISAAPPGSRVRSRSFRSAFLLSYAHRIDERLEAVTRQVETEADGEVGGVLVPVLTARSQAIDERIHDMFDQLRTARSPQQVDGFGWQRGREAADRASLAAGSIDR